MRWLLILLSVLASGVAHAHANGSSYLRIESGDGNSGLAAAWDIAAADLSMPLELDADGDGVLAGGEIQSRRSAIARFAIARLGVRRGGEDCRLSAGGITTTVRESEQYVSLQLAGACPADGPLEVSTGLFFGSAGYSALIDAQTANGRFPAVLSFANPVWSEPPVASVSGTLLRFLREGVWHVLIGYDHVAFLLLLLLPSVLRSSRSGWEMATSSRDVAGELLKIVTAFTIAHSITLGLASTGTIRPPVQPIEAAIAGSIVVAGLLNLFPAASGLRLPLAFGFGLVHGFGFANALREIGAGEFRLALMLAGFNLGVELAQLLIVAAVLPILWLASRWPRYARQFMPALSLATALTGGIWFAGRL